MEEYCKYIIEFISIIDSILKKKQFLILAVSNVLKKENSGFSSTIYKPKQCSHKHIYSRCEVTIIGLNLY